VAARLGTTSHALLGLLSITPMSGYDLFQAVDRSVSRFWPISKSQVYAELARLEASELIDGTDVPQERRPDKRVFRLTVAGEQALDAWLDDGDVEDMQLRIPFLLKALFGHRRPPEHTAGLLAVVRDEAADEAARYAGFLKMLADAPDSEYARIVVLFGLKMAQAFAAWAEEARALLPEHEHRVDPRRPTPKTAPALFRAAPPRRPGRG
jgi:PadR family transcriptional regulator, regulatory protein AphA